ncbi:MAG: SpoIIE family protein phosphatase [Magnetococcales bacterium]|nr:SpoIIE family protein phosphatase [Magnetococcales bacterium]MBF0114586.1 SpoIIE family protein phosphatase [Magnetococcales bacterium]
MSDIGSRIWASMNEGHVPVILVVDDDADLRQLVRHRLREESYRVDEAADGASAIEYIKQAKPALILLDAEMPNLDGFDTCSIIKSAKENENISIVMVTALEDDQSIKRGFSSGAEEYITKPVNFEILTNRIRNILLRQQMERKIRWQRDKLAFERNFIEEIISRMRSAKRFNAFRVRFMFSPLEKASGDLLLSALRPDGGQHVMLGDFTGHGLTAAIAGPMVSDVFYSMTEKNIHMEEIIHEINRKLNKRMPVGMFMAACFLEIAPSMQQAKIWNFAMPDALIFRGDKLLHRVSSQFLSCGVVAQVEMMPFIYDHLQGSRIYFCSDGIVEAKNLSGQFFGADLLIDTIEKMIEQGDSLDAISNMLDTWHDTYGQDDDITLIEVSSDQD